MEQMSLPRENIWHHSTQHADKFLGYISKPQPVDKEVSVLIALGYGNFWCQP